MSWVIGYDDNWERDIGYGVPAYCDHPDCKKEIHRGLSYVCGGDPYGGVHGCGLYFCDEHLRFAGIKKEHKQLCKKCYHGKKPFQPKPEHPKWIRFKLRDKSWESWRFEHPDEVEKFKKALDMYKQELKAQKGELK